MVLSQKSQPGNQEYLQQRGRCRMKRSISHSWIYYVLIVVLLCGFNAASATLLDDMWNSLQGVYLESPSKLLSKESKHVAGEYDSCYITTSVGRLFNHSVMAEIRKKHQSPLTDDHSVRVSVLSWYTKNHLN